MADTQATTTAAPAGATQSAPAPAANAAPAAQATPAPAANGAAPAQGAATAKVDDKAPAATVMGVKAEEKKPDAAAPVKPDYSKLKMPDGTKLTQGDLDAIKAFGEKHNLSPEAAQAALEERHTAIGAYHDGLVKGHQATVGEWRKQVEAHPVLGGANLKATDEAVTQVLSKFGPKGFIETVQTAGYNWHPQFLEFVHNVYAATKDDSRVTGGNNIPSKKEEPRTLESMYEPKKK